jgi:hypothetical protein
MGLREPELQEGAKGQQKQKIIHTNTQRERERGRMEVTLGNPEDNCLTRRGSKDPSMRSMTRR